MQLAGVVERHRREGGIDAGRPGDAGQGDGPGKFRLRQACGLYRPAGSTLGELHRLNAEVLAAAGQLKPVTTGALLARSGWASGIEALLRGGPGTGSGA